MKKGQSGVNAAILVAVIAGAIILYILFLPTEERKALLEENDTVTFGDDSSEGDIKELLLEHPGRMEVVNKNKVEHDLLSFRLYDRSTAISLEKIEGMSARNAWFDEKNGQLMFSMTDFENTDNVVLSFNVKKGKGTLTVTLNDNEIYTGSLEQGNVGPIDLKKSMLRDGTNQIVFMVDGVGLAFWSTHEYLLEEVRVLGDLVDMESQVAEVTFLVSVSEEQNVDKSVLRFYPDCEQRTVGKLEIAINNRIIFSAVPDCGLLKPLEFNPEYITAGENNLVFRTLKGDILIDSLLVRNTLEETPSLTYYFEVSDEQLEKVVDDEADINATFIFVDDTSEKEADIIINGRTTNIPRTRALRYVRNLDIFVEEGSNSFKIVPEKAMDVRTLKIEYTEIS